MFHTREIECIQMRLLERLKALDASTVRLISHAGAVRAGGRISYDEFVSLVYRPVRKMRRLCQLVGDGKYELDEAKVMAKVEQAWNRPVKLNS